MLKNKRIIYLLCFVIGYILCWYIFSISILSNFYKKILNTLTYRGVIYFILFLFTVIFYSFLKKGVLNFFQSKKDKLIINTSTICAILVTILSTYLLCEKFVENWKIFAIHTLNYLLYIFAWYSLIKAMKVWYKYGNFFQLLLNGEIKKYTMIAIFFITILDIICFSLRLVDPVSAIGILLISLSVLLIVCFIVTIFVQRSKMLQSIISKWNTITAERIINKEQPKEVSIAYDQISAVGLSAVVSKRIFDISKDTDLQFIVSKLFKMFCYLISLSITCKYSKQMDKLKKSLVFFICIALLLLCLSYAKSFHELLLEKQQISKIANYIIDYVFFPLGIVKILIQIFTIIFAKKTTGISSAYFTISAFFTLITSCNLIVKGNFYDTTITVSLFKGLLYSLVMLIAIIINKLYPTKD